LLWAFEIGTGLCMAASGHGVGGSGSKGLEVDSFMNISHISESPTWQLRRIDRRNALELIPSSYLSMAIFMTRRKGEKRQDEHLDKELHFIEAYERKRHTSRARHSK